MGRLLIVSGLVLVAVGLLISLGLPFGRLPLDVTFKRGSLTIHVPVTTSILASIVLTLVATWLSRR